MADAKVSELTSATSAGGSDVFYVVQSNTSKKISAANLFGNISNPTLTGNIVIGGTPQTLGSPGIVSITTPITHLSSDAIGGTLQIPSGTQGQFKLLTMTATAGGSYTVATSNIAGNTSIVFDAVGDTVLLYFTNGKWAPIASSAALDLTSISSNVIPSANSVYDLGSATNQWRSLYVSNNTIFIGGTPLMVVNGELVIGSGESSANLATVAYVDGAVANAGGGGGLTSADLTTANVTELTSLYYTNARVNSFVTPSLTTANVSEVTNLYFTNTRAVAAVTNNNITLGNVTATSLTTTNVIARVGAATGNVVTNVRTWDSAGANLYIWFNAANTPELVTLGNFGNIVGWTVSVSGGNSATVTETNPAGYFSISTSAALTGSGTLTFTSPDYTPLPLNLKADGKTWRFDNTGTLTVPGPIEGLGNSKLDFTTYGANTAYLTTTSDDSTALFMGAGTAELYAQTNILIKTNTGGTAKVWTFGDDGSLNAPGDIIVSGDVSGTTSASTLNLIAQLNSNTFIQLNNIVDSSIRTQANLEIRTNGVDSPSVWNFDITGDLTIPGSIVSSNSFTVISEVGGTSSGVFLDGANNAILFATSNAIIRSDNDGTFKDWTFSADGNLTAPGIISANTVNASTSFGLPVYATDAARDTAIPSPQTGMMVYVSGGEGAGLQVRGANNWNTVSQTSN